MGNDNSDLPEKVYLKLVAAYLAPKANTPREELDIICAHQNHGKKLILKSEEVFSERPAQLVSDGWEERFKYDMNGEEHVSIYSGGATQWLSSDGRPLTLGPAYPTESHARPALTTRTFTFDGKEYYLLDETQEFLISLDHDPGKIYVDKSDFQDYLKHGAEQLPLYADKNSEFYAPELVLAIEAHQAIIVEGYRKLDFKGRPERIEAWLTEFHPDLHRIELSKRISTIISKGNKQNEQNKGTPPTNKSS